jgi:hypothetical protein
MTTRVRLVAALLLVLLSAACVGPARTTSTYQGKAGHTAEAALSQLETALLAVSSSTHGNMLHSYLLVVLSESEDNFSSIQATFDSIQPPNSQVADQVRDKLDQLLSDGADGLAQLRIAARRNHTATLIATAQDLAKTADDLSAFSEDPAP